MNVNLQDGVRSMLEVHKEKKPEGHTQFIINTDNYTSLKMLYAVIQLLEEIERSTKIMNYHTCHDCLAVKDCSSRPGWGEPIRINCPAYVGEE